MPKQSELDEFDELISIELKVDLALFSDAKLSFQFELSDYRFSVTVPVSALSEYDAIDGYELEVSKSVLQVLMGKEFNKQQNSNDTDD